MDRKSSILATFWKTWNLRSNSVTRQVNFLIGQKLLENAKIEKLKCDILGDFQTLWESDLYEQTISILIFEDLQVLYN